MELLELVRNNLGKPYEDLEFLLNCLKEVMIESGENELASEIPWINSVKDFQNNPLFGLGPRREDSWTVKLYSNISAISGIGELLAGFGLTGFIFFIILSFRTSVLFSKTFNYKGKILLFLIIIFISISYSIIFLPLVMCFWMFQLFEPEDINKQILKPV